MKQSAKNARLIRQWNKARDRGRKINALHLSRFANLMERKYIYTNDTRTRLLA